MEQSTIASLIIGSFALVITLIHNRHQRKLANDRLEKELFKEFNERYAIINDRLYSINWQEDPELMDGGREVWTRNINICRDYFILCAEEYYWFNKGRISEKIWKSWQVGIDFWFERKLIQQAWKSEMAESDPASYYLDPGDAFFTKGRN